MCRSFFWEQRMEVRCIQIWNDKNWGLLAWGSLEVELVPHPFFLGFTSTAPASQTPQASICFLCLRAAIPKLWHQEDHWKTIFPWIWVWGGMVSGWFKCIIMHFISIIRNKNNNNNYQHYLRSSGIRSQRLGTSAFRLSLQDRDNFVPSTKELRPSV